MDGKVKRQRDREKWRKKDLN